MSDLENWSLDLKNVLVTLMPSDMLSLLQELLQNGAPCYAEKITRASQKQNSVRVLPWARHLLNMGPIGHIYGDYQTDNCTRNELNLFPVTNWIKSCVQPEIPSSKITDLVSSLPDRVKAFKDAKGTSTKY